ncbi:hypothetical protein NEMIN01_1570 [Nematocida minor]|uniref:uncharacterized protein n=1 Tax=Nematocida minor TaxID=1912983 RepID=UPI00222077C4|nr:uncharacterized protein NEMIN01_1570 [Nematocida minor]KAI5191544.1 hypothetical protein NEMIN01_1570 [Nematocida minor]
MKVFEEVVSCSLPVDYFAAATFLNGVYFISYSAVYKYFTTGHIEKYPFPAISPSFSKVISTECGEYLVFTQKNVQTVYNPSLNYMDTVTLSGKPTRTLIDKFAVINLLYNEIHIYHINKKGHISKYKIPQSKLINKYRIRKIARQDGRMLLIEDKLVEIRLRIKESQSTGADIGGLDMMINVGMKSPVLIEPEPITFCAKPLEDILCTTWGGVMKYETGMEVYSRNYENYKLEYIYKTDGEIISTQDRVEAEEKLFLQETSQDQDGSVVNIVEIGKDGPVVIFQIKKKEKVYVINKSTFLVTGVVDRVVRCKKDTGTYHAPAVELSKEKNIQRKESEVIEESMEYLRGYRNIEFVLEDASEEENAMYIEKILNSFKEDVTAKILALGIMLSKKIEYIKETKEEIEKIEEKTRERICEASDKNERIIGRMSRIIKDMQDLKDKDINEDRNTLERIHVLKKKIEELKEKVKTKSTQERLVKEKGEYCLLKQQNEYLMKKLETMN